MRKRISILGSDTREGQKAFNFFINHSNKYDITFLSCYNSENQKIFEDQIVKCKNLKDIYVREESYYKKLLLDSKKYNIYFKERDDLSKLIKFSDSDIVVFCLSGNKCIKPILSAINEFKDVCIVNLDPILYSGKIIINQAKNKSVNLYFISYAIYSLDLFLNNRSINNISKISLVSTKQKNITKEYINKFKKQYDFYDFKKKIVSLYRLDFIRDMFLINYIFEINAEQFLFYEENKRLLNIIVSFKDGANLSNSTTQDVNNIYNYYFLNNLDYDSFNKNKEYIQNLEYKIKKLDSENNIVLNLGVKALKKGGSIPILVYIAFIICLEKVYDNNLNINKVFDIIEQIIDKRNLYVANPDLKTILALRNKLVEFINKYLKSNKKQNKKTNIKTKEVKSKK
jgi:1-deoxy-D-xylulose 5-phosphate reductoisomerase